MAKRIYSDEERLERKRASAKKSYQKNKDKKKQYTNKYFNSPFGRAIRLVNNYKNMDKRAKREDGNLTPKWVFENIFTQPCAHCGKTGWDIIGCNRIDNSKPHTMDNVEPCCWECNAKLNGEDLRNRVSIPVYQYTLDGEFVAKYDSVTEASLTLIGRRTSHIGDVCRGLRKKAYGYKWSYEPL